MFSGLEKNIALNNITSNILFSKGILLICKENEFYPFSGSSMNTSDSLLL